MELPVFDWEEAVRNDRDLLRMDAFVQRAISKLPGQPPPRADAGRGSRFAPAPPVKSEAVADSGSATTMPDEAMETPQFIDPKDYESQSSSEYDMREVDPMDELSDFGTPLQEQEQEQEQPLEPIQEQEMDRTVCEVCKSSEREGEIVLCDDCDAEYHIFCLKPPLTSVPKEQWYCTKCKPKHSAVETEATVKAEQVLAAETSAGGSGDAGAVQTSASVADASAGASTTDVPMESAPSSGGTAPTNAGNDPTSIPIAQALKGDPEKSNLLLVHACSCDDIQCTDSEYCMFCPHMKRFLRSVCWASHSEKWRSYRLARITAELFAYHAMNCNVADCNVPLCVQIRQEEIV